MMKRVGNSGLVPSCEQIQHSTIYLRLATVTKLAFRLTAQLIGPRTKEQFTDGPRLQDLDLVNGHNRGQYASFTWADLAAIAPWLELTKKIDGPGLAN